MECQTLIANSEDAILCAINKEVTCSKYQVTYGAGPLRHHHHVCVCARWRNKRRFLPIPGVESFVITIDRSTKVIQLGFRRGSQEGIRLMNSDPRNFFFFLTGSPQNRWG